MKLFILYNNGEKLDNAVEIDIKSFTFENNKCIIYPIKLQLVGEMCALCSATIVSANQFNCIIEGIQQCTVDFQTIIRYFCVWKIVY